MIQTHMATPRTPETSARSQPAFKVNSAQSDATSADSSVFSLRQHTQATSENQPTATHLLGEKLGGQEKLGGHAQKLGEKLGGHTPQTGDLALFATTTDDEHDLNQQPAEGNLGSAAAVLAELMSTQMHLQQNRGTFGGNAEMPQAQMNIQGATQQKEASPALTATSPQPAETLSQTALNQTEKNALKPAALSPDFQQPLSTTASLLSTLNSPQATSSAQAQVTSPPVTTATTTGAEWATVRVDPQAGKWGEQMLSILHDRVTLQAQQHVQEAKIRLDPPDLGKLDLFVRVDGDRLSVQIHANTVATREALLQVSDRLRAELQEQHFVHVDVNVGSEHSGGHRQSATNDNESTIFAARADQQTADDMTFTSEHWLSTKA